MNRELVTDPLGPEDLWVDLGENIEFLIASGYKDALVFFGFAWGEKIYEDRWQEIPITLNDLEKKVREAESKGSGGSTAPMAERVGGDVPPTRCEEVGTLPVHHRRVFRQSAT